MNASTVTRNARVVAELAASAPPPIRESAAWLVAQPPLSQIMTNE